MQEVFNFILSHYEPLLALAMFILSIVFCLVRKKPVNSILYSITEAAVMATQIVEKTELKGKEKLEKCLEIINVFLKKEFPNIDINSYRNTAISIIENILTTPQKKGE